MYIVAWTELVEYFDQKDSFYELYPSHSLALERYKEVKSWKNVKECVMGSITDI